MSRQQQETPKTSTTAAAAGWVLWTLATSAVSNSAAFLTKRTLSTIVTPAVEVTANTAGFLAANIALPAAWWLTTTAVAGTLYVAKSTVTGAYTLFFRSPAHRTATRVQDLDDETAMELIRQAGSFADLADLPAGDEPTMFAP